MTREKEILEILRELTAVKSISDTEDEHLAQEYIEKRLKNQEFFKRYLGQEERGAGRLPLTGTFNIPGDYRNRKAVYGLAKGNSRKTLILMGHYDVVGVEEFGKWKEDAFSIDRLLEKIKLEGQENGYEEEAVKDAFSGEWIFGRGTADMKGGLAIGLAVLNEYGKRLLERNLKEELEENSEGNILFLAVPDEESYSSGMRGAVSLLDILQEQYTLEYECLIDLEPNFIVEGKQEVFVGSVGKCMPVVLVQGAKAHVGSCFQGINAVALLGEIFRRTEFSLEFADSFEGETCMPPVWLQLRDMKDEYDVSLPYRAGGYLNVLSFSETPEEIMRKLEKNAREALKDYQKRQEQIWIEWKKRGENISQKGESRCRENCPGAHLTVQVMFYEELIEVCRKGRTEEFLLFYNNLYQEIERKIHAGQWNYPQAAMEMMKSLLDYSGIGFPVILLAFAPPFYPAFHSDKLGKGEQAGSCWYDMLERAGQELFGLELRKKHYFSGISDLSYCGISGNNRGIEFYGRQTPLWGKLYEIDFRTIGKLNIPSILFGPVSKDIHQRTERVNRNSLIKEIPQILFKLIEQMFAKNEVL
ncbi:M20/M25/M40 family metallo-hydrolase [Lachnospiraceae bacterium 62-35]